MLKVVANMQNLNNSTVLLVLLFELCVSKFKKKGTVGSCTQFQKSLETNDKA